MSLLFNMLSRLVIAFLPRSKRLLISWLQSPSAVILEPLKNKVSHCFHCFPIYLPWSNGTRCHDLSFLNVEFLSKLLALSLSGLKTQLLGCSMPIHSLPNTCIASLSMFEGNEERWDEEREGQRKGLEDKWYTGRQEATEISYPISRSQGGRSTGFGKGKARETTVVITGGLETLASPTEVGPSGRSQQT